MCNLWLQTLRPDSVYNDNKRSDIDIIKIALVELPCRSTSTVAPVSLLRKLDELFSEISTFKNVDKRARRGLKAPHDALSIFQALR